VAVIGGLIGGPEIEALLHRADVTHAM
jgi:hypothetical protein